MLSRAFLSFDIANKMSDVAIQTARSSKFAPVSVVVLDFSGNIIVQKRMDYCPAVGMPEFALAKANACLVTKSSSRTYRDKYTTYKEGGNPTHTDYIIYISSNTSILIHILHN